MVYLQSPTVRWKERALYALIIQSSTRKFNNQTKYVVNENLKNSSMLEKQRQIFVHIVKKSNAHASRSPVLQPPVHVHHHANDSIS